MYWLSLYTYILLNFHHYTSLFITLFLSRAGTYMSHYYSFPQTTCRSARYWALYNLDGRDINCNRAKKLFWYRPPTHAVSQTLLHIFWQPRTLFSLPPIPHNVLIRSRAFIHCGDNWIWCLLVTRSWFFPWLVYDVSLFVAGLARHGVFSVARYSAFVV